MRFSKTNYFLIVIFIHFGLVAQQDAQYTNYMYNTQIVNPAYVGNRGLTSINLLARTQWLDLDGSPETTALSIDSSIGENERMGIGLSVFSDKIGPTSENRVNIDYSYAINFLWSKLTFGIKAGLVEMDIDYSKLNIANLSDPLLQYNYNKIQPRLGLGFYFNTEKYYLGFSAPNLLETRYYDELNIENTFFSKVSDRIHYYLIAGYVFDISSKVKVKPASLIKVVRGAPVQWDLSMNFLFNYKVTLGISNRLDSAISALGGFQLSDNFFVGLSYDYTAHQIKNFNDGTYELILRIDLMNKDRKILTPRFF